MPAQDLYAEELVVPGSDWYINNEFADHRDATFEEILHLVQDAGIGVDGHNSQPGALPAYQANIRAATNNAMENDFEIWPIGGDSDSETMAWFDENVTDNNLTQEYLATVVDSYYGLWGPYTDADGGMWGGYIAKTRADIEAQDPLPGSSAAGQDDLVIEHHVPSTDLVVVHEPGSAPESTALPFNGDPVMTFVYLGIISFITIVVAAALLAL